jgi:LPXTG-motif cell wall-anchored protein
MWDPENDGSYEKTKVVRLECGGGGEETSFLVTKALVGAEYIGTDEGWPFTVHVTIVSDSATVYDADVLLTEAKPTYTIVGLPEEWTATVVETGNGGADGVSYSPVSGVVTHTTGASSEVTVTNTFTEQEENGEVTITKAIIGAENMGAGEGWPFTIDVIITSDGNVILDESYQLTEAAPSVTIPSVPYDATVAAAETGKGGADLTTYSPAAPDGQSGILVYEEEPATITVTNTYEPVEVGGVDVTRPTAPGAATLPRTGSDTGAPTAVAAALVVSGLVLVLASRRRVPTLG